MYNIGENLSDIALGYDFLGTTRKIWSLKEKNDNLDIILKERKKEKERKWKDKMQTGRKYLQKTHLKKHYCWKLTFIQKPTHGCLEQLYA